MNTSITTSIKWIVLIALVMIAWSKFGHLASQASTEEATIGIVGLIFTGLIVVVIAIMPFIKWLLNQFNSRGN
jgi:heme/copper-type cytochrome/quinol oxidase subunit 2